MDFSTLREKKEAKENRAREIMVDDLYIGINPYIVKHFLKNETESKIILLEKSININDFRFRGPTKYRGMDEEALEAVDDKTFKPYFYKDGGFRSFEGRSKPQALKDGEVFYKSIGIDIDVDQFYESPIEEVQYRVRGGAQENILTGIELGETLSIVHCSNGETYKVKNLYWGNSLPELIELTNNKSIFPSSIMEGLDLLKGPSKFVIEFEFNCKFGDRDKTYFIPFSQASESGHFIGEFKDFDGINRNLQKGVFVYHLNSEDLSEEYLSSVVKKLKVHLKRIFNLKDVDFVGEYFWVDPSPSPLGSFSKEEILDFLTKISVSMVSEYAISQSGSTEFGHQAGLTSLNH